MERYLGLDVHAASSTLAVISESGKRLQTHVLETNGRALVEAVRLIPGRKHLVFEEGAQSAWLYEILSLHVDEAVVAGVTKSRGQKDDRRDAYGLAEKLRTGTLDKRIFKAPRQFAMLRELARMHQTIGRDLVRVQVRLKTLYRSRGIGTPGRTVYGKTHREPWQQQLPATARTTATRLYEQIDFLVALKEQAEQDLIRESRKHPIARVLETTPGLGTPDGRWLRAPVQQTRGLTRHHNHTLKDVFKGAATTIITQAPDDPLYHDYERATKAGTKPNLAKLTLARKIASTALALWKKEEPYRPRHRTAHEADRRA